MEDMKRNILNTVNDLVSTFLYYDRKEDEDLRLGQIEEAIKNGEITENEIIEKFTAVLHEGLKED